MAESKSRVFELTAAVNFPTVDRHMLEEFAGKLASAVESVIGEYPTAVAYLVAADVTAGEITFGIRFDGADPRYIAEMADDILEEAVELVAKREGSGPIETEREESVLVLA
ncbi:hypothetical protein MN032_04455 [Agromyces atrinae]|uniref:hypothetical protein n=1 Tax=Agromyces atrinae TaxID=592376 RepID=UPI001F56C746|nr:hypothetical protein [Agromyces atrinae]MCI2956935.1 hypothetical protein [Agromyces atrinae]